MAPTEQSSSGAADTVTEMLNVQGQWIWRRSERGTIEHRSYDAATGAVIQRIEDVDTDIAANVPTGWQTPIGGGLHLVTDMEVDSQGRVTQTLGPIHTARVNEIETEVRSANWTVYRDIQQTTLTAHGYAHGESFAQYELVNPVRIEIRNPDGHLLEEISAVRNQASGKLSASDSFSQSDFVHWTTHGYTEYCLRDSTRVYHDIPTSGIGEAGTHYNETRFGYDSQKRKNRTVTPGGTITQIVFDARGNEVARFIGTNDAGATEQDPTGGDAPGNDMVALHENVYDDGQPGGDGLLTNAIAHVDSTDVRTTEFVYDWRHRQVATIGELDFYQENFYDNQDRQVRTEQRTQDTLLTRTDTYFDSRERVYRTVRFGIDPATGIPTGETQTTSTRYDSAGDPIEHLAPDALVPTETEYDSLDRPVKFTDELGFSTSTSYNQAGQVVTTTDRRGKISTRS